MPILRGMIISESASIQCPEDSAAVQWRHRLEKTTLHLRHTYWVIRVQADWGCGEVVGRSFEGGGQGAPSWTTPASRPDRISGRLQVCVIIAMYSLPRSGRCG